MRLITSCLMNIAIMSAQRGRFYGRKGAQAAGVRPSPLVTGLSVVVEAGPLGEGFSTIRA